jgi:hypothetical protein
VVTQSKGTLLVEKYSSGCLEREILRDPSTIILKKISKTLIVQEIMSRKDGSPEGLYIREGDA